MITINLSPQRNDIAPLSASLSGYVLTVDGVPYDLSLIADEATVYHPVIQDCTRTGNDYELTLILTHGASAPEETRFPVPVIVTTDGEINFPPYEVTV